MSVATADSAPPPSGGSARLLAGPVISAISIATVVWWALHQQAPRLPTSSSSIWLLVLTLAIYAGVTAMRGVRWYTILRRAGIRASMLDTQALIVVGYMGNTVLPARGGELLRIFLLGERTGASRIKILGTVLAERLLDVVALLTLLVLLAFTGTAGMRSSPSLELAAAGLLLALGLTLLLGWRLSRAGRLRGLSDRIEALTLATRNLLSAQGAALVLLTAAAWIGEGCIYWLVGRALDLPLGLPQGCFLVMLSSLAATIPAAPGYAGTYDAAIQLGLHSLHVRGAPALTFGLLVRVIVFLPITIVGAILVVVRYGGLSSLRRARRGDGSSNTALARVAE
jgi:uncharacterized membrane protein YbhN (UPF0104 family)